MGTIISFSGTLGAGKDTAADECLTMAAQEGLVARKFSFASNVYAQIAQAFGVSISALQDRRTKETPVDWLCLDRCENKDYVSVALPLISRWREAEGKDPISMDSPVSPREVLRSWGTEFRRESKFGHESYWVDLVEQMLHENPQVDLWLCSDCRMDNEKALLDSQGAVFVRINATHLPENDADFEHKHASDSKWRKWDFAHTVLYDFGNRQAFRSTLQAISDEALSMNQSHRA